MNYEKLKNYQETIAQLECLDNILWWELRTDCPKSAIDYLSNLITKTELQIFELKSSSEYQIYLDNFLNSEEVKNYNYEIISYYQQFRKKIILNRKVPKDFYEQYAALKTVCNTFWTKAREENDYNIYKPYLEQMIAMTKTYYNYMYPDMDLYDAMLDTYENGMTSDVIDKLFDDLKRELIPLIKNLKVKEANKNYERQYTRSELVTCAEYLLNYIGFDLNRGTLGIYPHGFTEKMNKDDIRIAFKQGTNPIDFVSTIIHEGGHGIFEQQIRSDLATIQNSCIENCYALHESQSRFYENILGRNINFWYPIYEDIKKLLSLNLTLEEFVAELNNAKPSLIRTEADELTYCLHIIVRYEIERELFSETITCEDLPRVWNEKMVKYLGVKVPNDSLGVMQDVHWSEGSFGYFPSYLLGSIYDGMFAEALERDLGPIDELLRTNQIKEITKYLGDKIHQYGGAYLSKEVIERVCGKDISVEPLIAYFKRKYMNN